MDVLDIGGLTHAVEGTHKDMIRVQLLGVWVLGLLGQGVLNSLGQLQELPLVHALPCLGPFELAFRIHSWCRGQGARGVVFKGQKELLVNMMIVVIMMSIMMMVMMMVVMMV